MTPNKLPPLPESELQQYVQAAQRLAIERAKYRSLCARMAQCLEMVRDAETDQRSEGRSHMPDGPLFAVNRVLADYEELKERDNG